MEEIFYLNGALIPKSQAKISILDYGFLYGYGLYETIRAYGTKPFRLDNHLARLRYSGDRLGITVHPALLRQAVQDVIEANKFKEARIRITISAGEGSIAPNLSSNAQSTIAVLASEYQPFATEKYEQGFKAIISEIRRNKRSPVTFMKSGNGIENMLARQEAKKAGADEAIFLNETGYVSEASGSNIFLVTNGVLKTPRFETGILPGVTRVVIFEIAANLGLKVKEVNIKTQDMMDADEVFVTNSLIEVMPVTEISSKSIGNGKPGEITRKLMNAYREIVEKETTLESV